LAGYSIRPARPVWTRTTKISAKLWAIGACTPVLRRELPVRSLGSARCRPASWTRHTNPSRVHPQRLLEVGLHGAYLVDDRASAPPLTTPTQLSMTRMPSFGTPICSAAPTWCPTARSAMAALVDRGTASPVRTNPRATSPASAPADAAHGTDAPGGSASGPQC
jgi:hypothetical protein